MNYLLWILQFLLGALFVFAGVMKFVMPYEEMVAQSSVQLPKWFILFIGVCEILGGLGLVLPWLLKVKPGLTPLAAGLLLIIMIGAVVTSAIDSPANAVVPLVVGILLALIAYKRRGELTLR